MLSDWDCFLSNVKSEWENWNKGIERFPNNLVVLYAGLTFFEEEENPLNEPFELSDGTQCFLTRLWPVGKFDNITYFYKKIWSGL